jgi:outer membrane receptor protein involved in Fe transport
MIRSFRTSGLLAGVALCALGGSPALAQEVAASGSGNADIARADTIVIQGEIIYRNRSETTAPVLEYGLDYFQRFEPLSVGDALKRVPSVAFLSDVLESDGVRLRGLDPAYTQILINGEQAPGAGADSGAFGNGADTAFFVDRIPAELIERIEIVRSASANRSGDALAGGLNIVLRDGYSLEGGYVRMGALSFDDGRVRESFAAVWGGTLAGGRALLGANVQGRRNPKVKFSQRFDAPGSALVNTEEQTDTRNGTDYSANAAWEGRVGGGELRLDGFFVKTDRTQDEDSVEYRAGVANFANLLTLNDNDVAIDQESYSLNGRYSFSALGGETSIKLGYAAFSNDEYEFEDEMEYLRDALIYPEADRYTGEQFRSDISDDEFKAKLEHKRDLGSNVLELGLQYETKTRDSLIREASPRIRTGSNGVPSIASGVRYPGPRPTTAIAARPFAPVAGGDNAIERRRLDPFAMVSGRSGAADWEAGLRLETTTIDITDRTAGAAIVSNDYRILLPSAHVKWTISENDRMHASIARTTRNPSFNFLSPALLEAELGDNDFFGNPLLKPETAWGVDIGLERRLGKVGVAGVNVFYRSVSDLIELYNTGAEGSEGPGTFEYSARNTGDGVVYGVEFDLSTPLGAFGLPDTGAFFNLSLLDSEIDDEFGSRRFNSQSDYIANIGFIHDLPKLEAAFGVTYRKQGDARSRVVGEEVVTSYGGDLEAFVEKRFGTGFTLRFTGSNLLDASKDEVFDKFTTFADQVARDYDEYELESEQAGAVFQITGRMAF